MKFRSDHPIAALREFDRPQRRDILRAFAKRVAWLEQRIAQRESAVPYQRCGFERDELAAIAVAVELIEAGAS